GDERQDADLAPRQAGRRDPRRHDLHGKPPCRERPRGALRVGRGALDGVLEVVGGTRVRELIEEPGQVALEAAGSIHAHAIAPPEAPADVTSSIDSEDRRIPKDRWRRDFAVPPGMPSMA